jgi:hypothetical protein
MAAVAWLGARADVALGCPGCRLGRQVRARLLGPDFWSNLAIAVAPVLVVCLVALLAYRVEGGAQR